LPVDIDISMTDQVAELAQERLGQASKRALAVLVDVKKPGAAREAGLMPRIPSPLSTPIAHGGKR